jgi:predicted MFS family arabinose efflux permease
MNRHGWQSPFFLMGVLGCAGSVALLFLVPKEKQPSHARSQPAPYLRTFSKLFSNRPALGTLGYAFWVSAANDNLFVVYGAWLEKSFGLGLVALGLGTSLLGASELAGEGLTAAVSDRIGPKRAVLVGLCCSIVSYLLLPWLNTSLPAALTGIGLLFFTFEFTLVTSLTLSTELLPGYRATMMAAFFSTAGVGRVVGALMGGFVWQAGGIFATGITSGFLTGMALFCMVWGLKGFSADKR